jgi:hypothetical protein
VADAPTFTTPLDNKITGDDPLGIAPTNERMFGAIFPGINNVVRYLRVYSALCWTVERIDTYLKKQDGKLTVEQAREVSDNALEKMQLALLWRNQGLGYTQLAGLRREFPVHNRPVRLTFDSFGTNQADLLDPGAYKPSLTRGLGFLETDGRTYRCTPAGKQLAAAFDAVASADNRYRWLSDVTALTTRRDDIFSIEAALSLARVSDDERSAFLAQFFPPKTEGGLDQLAQNRWLSIHLALRAVDLVCKARTAEGSSAVANEHDVRACMARARFGDRRLDLNSLSTVHAWWAVLQVRQLQRLALDVLFSVTETWLAQRRIQGTTLSIDELAGEVGNGVTPQLGEPYQESVSALWDSFKEAQGEHGTLYEAADEADAERRDLDVFSHFQVLLDSNPGAHEELPGIATDAFMALVFCAVEAENLSVSNEHARDVLRRDLDSCSLLSLHAFLQRDAFAAPALMVSKLVKHWVILRHFDVVTNRGQRGAYKNRFRFLVGDDGLERFDPAAPLSGVSVGNDRLAHILMMCEQSGILRVNDYGYALTSDGRRRLKEL